MQYRLLDAFKELFEGKRYLHRRSTLGDWVAMHLFEDLFALRKSSKLCDRVAKGERVLNTRNLRRGIKARRGDGSFGDLVPNTPIVRDTGFAVARGTIATVEIGAEVKILAKAMIKQIDRVMGDLVKQVGQFERGGGNPICVGITGINFSGVYTSYEKRRAYKTTGRDGYLHPHQEAPEAERRVLAGAKPSYDEFLVLRFRATNVPPYPFEWVNYEDTARDYGALLVRASWEYDKRF